MIGTRGVATGTGARATGVVAGTADLDDATVRHVDLDGVRVRYLVAGGGPPVVLVHGGDMDSAAVS